MPDAPAKTYINAEFPRTLPDPEIRIESPADRSPVNDQFPRHTYVESEFAPGCGRCDTCGGGPLHEIHQEQVDPLDRIAEYLERIAVAAELAGDRSALALERIAAYYDILLQESLEERGQ